MATLVFAFDLGLLSFLSWTWSVSWWKDDQLKELWWGPLKKATKKSALPPDYDLSSFFSGRWLVCWTNLDIPTCKTPRLVCWTNLDIPTCKTPNPPEKKLDIPPPPTHKVLLLQHTVFSKMSWWNDGQLSLCIWSWPVVFLVLDLVLSWPCLGLDLSCLGLGLGPGPGLMSRSCVLMKGWPTDLW